MTARERLANRRPHAVVDFHHGGFAFTAGIGRFDDGRIAEVFLMAAKSGTVVEAWARDAAIVASICFQHGIAPATIRHALSRDAGGVAASPLGALLDILAEGDVQ
jgi:ribonucleoside-diphosphate reductase alpha chain